MEKKLLEQAKDAVAKECGWSDFNDVIKHELDFSPNAIIDSVAIEYNRLCNEWISVRENGVCKCSNGHECYDIVIKEIEKIVK